MRHNEFNSLEEFTSSYIGVWDPSRDHWFGLDFSYHGTEYRLHTGLMYADEEAQLEDGSVVLFGLYIKNDEEYQLLKQYGSMKDLLESTEIEDTVFKTVIMADETILLGQD